MALKSGQMAYLTVSPAVFEKARAFLKTVVQPGSGGGRFTYMPGVRLADSEDYERATTAIGLLCRQYLHTARNDPAMVEGTAFPHAKPARQRRAQRLLLVLCHASDAQSAGTGLGRLEPEDAAYLDRHAMQGRLRGGKLEPCRAGKGRLGRRRRTADDDCLSALTLEVYYRYLPLYKLDAASDEAAPCETDEEAFGTKYGRFRDRRHARKGVERHQSTPFAAQDVPPTYSPFSSSLLR